MDDITHPEQSQTSENEDKPSSKSLQEVGVLAHQSVSYTFDPKKEPLLRDNPRRFVIFPIEYQDIWQMYKKVSYIEFIKTDSSRLVVL